jgi:hypothetical protein
VTSRQPAWLRLLLAVVTALVSIAFTSCQYRLITSLAWFVGYSVLLGIPWLIVHRLSIKHPLRILQAEHEQRAERFSSYRNREGVWLGFGLLFALWAAHGVPSLQYLLHHGAVYGLGIFLVGIGIGATIYWRAQRHELESTDNS